jgi:hypothetical protein
MFNKIIFLRDVENIHLKLGETLAFRAIPEIDVRGKVDEIIDYDKSLFSKALDDICNNFVGNTMFRLLITKLPPGQMLTITDIGPEQASTEDSPIYQDGSSYTNYNVFVNSNLYNDEGVGIPERKYYCINESGIIGLKDKSISSSIFHEFTHCLHDIEDRRRYRLYYRSEFPDGNPWDDMEELRTIAGYVDSGVYDPICDNCFSLYCSAVPAISFRTVGAISLPHHSTIPQGKFSYRKKVVAKAIPYEPRFGHVVYVKVNPSREELLQSYKTLNFNLAWPKKYM